MRLLGILKDFVFIILFLNCFNFKALIIYLIILWASLLIGTHWTMEIVYLILADGYPEKINRSEKMSFGALEMSMPTMPVPAYKMAEDLPSPRVFPTHLPENILPPQIFQNKGKVKQHFLIRAFFKRAQKVAKQNKIMLTTKIRLPALILNADKC